MKRPNCDPASSSLPENCGTLLQTGRLSRRRPALLTLRGRSFGHAVGFRAALFDICLDSIGLIPNRSRKSAKCSCWGYCVKLPGTPCGPRDPSFHFRGAVNHTFTALVFPFPNVNTPHYTAALWEGCIDSSGTRTWVLVPPIGFDALQIAATDLLEESFAILLSSPRHFAVQFN